MKIDRYSHGKEALEAVGFGPEKVEFHAIETMATTDIENDGGSVVPIVSGQLEHTIRQCSYRLPDEHRLGFDAARRPWPAQWRPVVDHRVAIVPVHMVNDERKGRSSVIARQALSGNREIIDNDR